MTITKVTNHTQTISVNRVQSALKTVAYAFFTAITFGLFHYFLTLRPPMPAVTFEKVSLEAQPKGQLEDQFIEELNLTLQQNRNDPSSRKERIRKLHRTVIGLLEKNEQPLPKLGINHPDFKKIANASLIDELNHSGNQEEAIRAYGYNEEDLPRLLEVLEPEKYLVTL